MNDLVEELNTLIKLIETNSHSWRAPLPFSEINPSFAGYSTNALPYILKNEVSSYQVYGQKPLPLIACSARANVSLACQSLANIARDKYLISPVSL